MCTEQVLPVGKNRITYMQKVGGNSPNSRGRAEIVWWQNGEGR